MLRELGAEYVDADQLVHEALSPPVATDRPAGARTFRPDVAGADGGINRGRSARSFCRPPALERPGSPGHPAVQAKIRQHDWPILAPPVIVVDAIKLIEGGLYREVTPSGS